MWSEGWYVLGRSWDAGALAMLCTGLILMVFEAGAWQRWLGLAPGRAYLAAVVSNIAALAAVLVLGFVSVFTGGALLAMLAALAADVGIKVLIVLRACHHHESLPACRQVIGWVALATGVVTLVASLVASSIAASRAYESLGIATGTGG